MNKEALWKAVRNTLAIFGGISLILLTMFISPFLTLGLLSSILIGLLTYVMYDYYNDTNSKDT